MRRQGKGLAIIVATMALFVQNIPAQAREAKGGVADLYKQYCASCHGKAMEGAMAGPLLDDEWLTIGSEASLTRAIRDGVSGTSMPGWKNTLSEEQIRALVTHIREKNYEHQSKGVLAGLVTDGGELRSREYRFRLSTVATAESSVWALDFLPSGDMLYTEKNGGLWRHDGKQSHRIEGTPDVWFSNQGGLLDVKVHPDYPKQPWVYLSFSTKTGTNAKGRDVGSLRVVRGRIKDDRWQGEQTIFKAAEDTTVSRGWHFGSRFAFVDGYLYFTIGDGGSKGTAQKLGHQTGKVHRLHDDGRIPEDNPFATHSGALASIWSYGHRNPQGLTVSPSGELWSTEHGPRGGDELNLVKPGNNYGWPLRTLGINYNGTPIVIVPPRDDLVEPVHYWTPSIAVAGINFYTGTDFPAWRNDLLVGSLSRQELHRLRLRDGKLVDSEIIMKDQGRIRDVAVGKDGRLYLALNNKGNGNNTVVRLDPLP